MLVARYASPNIRRLSTPEADAARVRNLGAREQGVAVAARREEIVLRTAVALRADTPISADAGLDLAALEESVKRYALVLKWLDTPPERALSLVLDVIGIDAAMGGRNAKVVRDSVVHWFLETYFTA